MKVRWSIVLIGVGLLGLLLFPVTVHALVSSTNHIFWFLGRQAFVYSFFVMATLTLFFAAVFYLFYIRDDFDDED